MTFTAAFEAFESALADLVLSEEVTRQILTYVWTRPNFFGMASKAYAAEDGEFDILRRKPFTRLAIICALLPGLRQRFVDAGIPRQVWLDSIDDIRLRVRLYFEKTGKAGLSKNDARWLRHLMGFKLFKIGSLQFQPFEMLYLDKEGIGKDFMRFTETQKLRLPPGTPVLNTHIQHSADLRPETLRATFVQARDFFKHYLPSQDFKAFISYTWLLYPG
ncbi:MAG TPA: acyltransferase domain-containing protein, partial [Anaerolineaceae bacterium]|nr:acyltransferase domain-containing protein [Anaerolineaceae bacterium]